MANYRLLVHRPGAQAWQTYPLSGGTLNIGRAPENELILEDELVSRHHAALHFDERGAWIMDRASSNGVILGGQRLPANEWRMLPVNMTFTLGKTTLRLEVALPEAPPPPPLYAAPPEAGIASAQPGQSTFDIKNYSLPLVVALIAVTCLCLVALGVLAWALAPRLPL